MQRTRKRDRRLKNGGDAAATADATRERRRRHFAVTVPIGIEKALYLAASDPEFRRVLLDERGRAADLLALCDTERATLVGVPRAALEAMVARIRPAAHGKRRFMKAVAAAAVSFAAGTAGAGCGREVESDIGTPGDGIDPETYVDEGWTEDARDVVESEIVESWGGDGMDPETYYDDHWTPDFVDAGADVPGEASDDADAGGEGEEADAEEDGDGQEAEADEPTPPPTNGGTVPDAG